MSLTSEGNIHSMNVWIAIIKLPPHCVAVINVQVLSSLILMILTQLLTTLRGEQALRYHAPPTYLLILYVNGSMCTIQRH